jgi:hypothetical protein
MTTPEPKLYQIIPGPSLTADQYLAIDAMLPIYNSEWAWKRAFYFSGERFLEVWRDLP